MTSTEALIVTLLPTLSIFSFVAITLETTIENNLTKYWRFSREMSMMGSIIMKNCLWDYTVIQRHSKTGVFL